MKITTSHLESVKALLLKASSQLSDQTKSAKAAEERRVELAAEVRVYQSAFDIAAAGYGQDTDLSVAQLDSLPVAAQKAIGYEKAPASLPPDALDVADEK